MEVTVKLQAKNLQQLESVVIAIQKLQKEHTGDCVLSVRFPTEVIGYDQNNPL